MNSVGHVKTAMDQLYITVRFASSFLFVVFLYYSLYYIDVRCINMNMSM